MPAARDAETAQIGSVTQDGRGIARVSGKRVLVAGALEGEEVRFRRRRKRRNYDEAELIEVLSASPDRVKPRCAVFGRCGGCTLQHVAISEQQQIKERALKDALARIGGLVPQRWLAPIEGPPWQYRRRARLAVKDVRGKGRVLVGFRERHTTFVTDMHRCEVLAAPLPALIDPLSELIGDLRIRARLPQIEVAVADNAVALVFRVLETPSEADIGRLEAFGTEHGLRIYLQAGRPDSLELVTPRGPLPPLSYRLPEFDLVIEFEATDFIQVNGPVNRAMVRAAIGLLGTDQDERVLDLFCGIGNFSLPLARVAAEVTGIEGEPGLVARAVANAARNGLVNCRFERADLSRIDGRERWLDGGFSGLVLDPPRSGALEVACNIGRVSPARIVYLSCHPGTLARDLKVLCGSGYRLEAAGIVDMFPHTGHVESIALLQKN